MGSGCTQTTNTTQSAAAAAVPVDVSGTFEIDGFLEGTETVLVTPMVESANAVRLRAKEAGVGEASIAAKAYGLKFFMLDPDAEIGIAFLRRAQIYHLESVPGQIVVDFNYLFCDGFLSAEVIKISEKTWTIYWPSDGTTVGRIDTLAEAVRSGKSAREAYDALASYLLGIGPGSAGERNKSERQVTWMTGRQLFEETAFEIGRIRDVGNRVAARFVR